MITNLHYYRLHDHRLQISLAYLCMVRLWLLAITIKNRTKCVETLYDILVSVIILLIKFTIKIINSYVHYCLPLQLHVLLCQ